MTHSFVTGWARIGVYPVTHPSIGDRIVSYRDGAPPVVEAVAILGDRGWMLCRPLSGGEHIEIPLRSSHPDAPGVRAEWAGATIWRSPHRCRSCGDPIPGEWTVRSTGQHRYVAEQVMHCRTCWMEAVRGDGHCYCGTYSTEAEADAVAAGLSR